MLKKYLWVVALGLALCGIQVSAQDKVTVYYPDGTVRIEDAAPAKKSEEKQSPAAVVAAVDPVPVSADSPAGSKTVTGVSCCPCNGGTDKCTPHCRPGRNAPEVTAVNSPDCPSDKKCEPIDVEFEGDLLVEEVEEKFYVECKDSKAHVPVPVIQTSIKETCEFKTVEKIVKCCKIKVCVPCQSCKVTTTKCITKLSTEQYAVRICKRRDGTYDVEVKGVPGMPTRWMLYLAGAKPEIEKDLGITIDF